MSTKSIALDGPSGAGKSTIAKRLAEELGLLYVDTGAIYRTLALFALRQDVNPSEEEAVRGILPRAEIRMDRNREDGLQHMYLGEEDVTGAIRTPPVSTAASQIAVHPCVREFLLDMQRDLARRHPVVMDGRDIGTVVLPDADVKIFLTASPEERARRRCAELLERGVSTTFETVLQDVIARDRRDSDRAVAPLRQAEDAVVVDTTNLSFEESVQTLLHIVREKML